MMPNLDRFLSAPITEAVANSVVSDEIGMAAELQDLADVVREAGAPRPADLMSDGEYIAYLESLLAMQGVTFSRVRAGAGGASGH
jgi:hypothetical protein